MVHICRSQCCSQMCTTHYPHTRVIHPSPHTQLPCGGTSRILSSACFKTHRKLPQPPCCCRVVEPLHVAHLYLVTSPPSQPLLMTTLLFFCEVNFKQQQTSLRNLFFKMWHFETYTSGQVWRFSRHFVGVSFLLPCMQSWELNSDCQVWQQEPLPTKPSCRCFSAVLAPGGRGEPALSPCHCE